MIKAVLFDMDGVLIDAREWHYEALNRALGLFGYTISRESHLSTFDGLPTRRKLELLSQSQGLPTRLAPIVNRLKQSYTLEISAQRCRPVFIHRYALSHLKAEGYRTAVCSNSIRDTVETLMRLSGLEPLLDLQLSNEDVTHSKPHPEIYLTAMAQLGLQPEECLILEDNMHGIEAANASGAHLLRIGTPDDVTYQAISARIAEIEGAGR
jgi:beta-phosphoglucomutase